jgi:hypothetical protein
MDLPPLPPTAKPPSFRLGTAPWVMWGGYAAIRLALFVVRPPSKMYGTPKLSADIVAMLILPTFFSWLFWRIKGRSNRARNVAFFVVFAMVLYGQLNPPPLN